MSRLARGASRRPIGLIRAAGPARARRGFARKI